MKVKTVAATTNKTERPFSANNLDQLAKTAPGVPVTVDFDPDQVIGKIISAKVVNGELEIIADIKNIDLTDQYIVPGYRLPNYDSVTFGLTRDPVDLSVSKAEEL